MFQLLRDGQGFYGDIFRLFKFHRSTFVVGLLFYPRNMGLIRNIRLKLTRSHVTIIHRTFLDFLKLDSL